MSEYLKPTDVAHQVNTGLKNAFFLYRIGLPISTGTIYKDIIALDESIGYPLKIYAEYACRTKLPRSDQNIKRSTDIILIKMTQPFGCFENLQDKLPFYEHTYTDEITAKARSKEGEIKRLAMLSDFYLMLAFGSNGFGKQTEHTFYEMATADFLFNRAQMLYKKHTDMKLGKQKLTPDQESYEWQKAMLAFEQNNVPALHAWEVYSQSTGNRLWKQIAERAILDYQRRIEIFNQEYPSFQIIDPLQTSIQ